MPKLGEARYVSGLQIIENAERLAGGATPVSYHLRGTILKIANCIAVTRFQTIHHPTPEGQFQSLDRLPGVMDDFVTFDRQDTESVVPVAEKFEYCRDLGRVII